MAADLPLSLGPDPLAFLARTYVPLRGLSRPGGLGPTGPEHLCGHVPM